MHTISSLSPWVSTYLGTAQLGDARRDRRFARMMNSAAARPAGRVTEVFSTPAERQAAYDFLEHEQVDPRKVQDAVGMGAALACSHLAETDVILDGTSLTLTDRGAAKDFGWIGSYRAGARGVKVLTSLVLSPDGVPLGVPALCFWARQKPATPTARQGYRPACERESARWREAVDEVDDRFRRNAPDTALHFIADREADASLLMAQIIGLGHGFTIRANGTRNVQIDGGKRNVLDVLRAVPHQRTIELRVQQSRKRQARSAKLVVTAAPVALILRDHHTGTARTRRLTAVWAREHGTCPPGEEPLNWLLYTTTTVKTLADAKAAIERYTRRWRIEDFHRTWKRGHCRVEETQLRSFGAVVKWATILAVVAARAEHLRHVARKTPDVPADTEFDNVELQALILLKQREKRQNETIDPEAVPTIEVAVRWIADLGGYVGSKSSGRPGATTIARGLERVLIAAEVLEQLRTNGVLR